MDDVATAPAGTRGIRGIRGTVDRDYLRQPGVTDVGRRLLAAFAARPDLVSPYGNRFLNRPVFLDAAETRGLETDLRALVRLMASLPARLSGGHRGRFARRLGHTGRFVEVMDEASGGPPRTPPLVARADLLHDGTGFKVLEVNVSGALGGFHNEVMAEIALGLPEIARFTAERRLRHRHSLELAADVLRRRVARPRPVVAVVDWPSSYDDEVVKQIHHLAEYLGDRGFWAIPGYADALRIRDGRVVMDGVAVDAVWRMHNLPEMIDDQDDVELAADMLRMEREGLVRSMTPFTDELLDSKAVLALLFEPEVRAGLTAAEIALVDRFVAPCRRVPGPGAALDAAVRGWRAEQSEFVLKAFSGKSGSGVTVGWAVDEREWAAALAEAAAQGGHLVQRRVRPVPEPFPDREVEGRTEPWFLKWGVFLIGGRYGGAMVDGARALDASVVNQGRSDGSGAVFDAAPDA